ncbi:MAG: valine--tRNA ligase [Mycobacteriales bacterium]
MTTRDALPETILPPQYTPSDVESVLYDRWIERGYFTADAASEKPAYTIVIPPPNVTGSLHMGHAPQHTLMDALTRRKRMQGYEALWLPGMDHAGIATQNVVERELAADGLTRHDLGREAFVERVWQWKSEYGGRILGQMRRLGDGVDWSRERFTMDEGLSRAVRAIFVRMYADGLIYRAERIINWCPRCLTALSDIEVEHSDDEGELVSLRYGDGANEIIVATTRVETMLGDTGIAVHPDDDRYRHLVGTLIELPLTGRMIPVVADEHVDPEFGTGAVKVTPAHDPNDFAIAQRHQLELISVMDESGAITVPGQFEGLDRFAARDAVTVALRDLGRVVAEKRPYVHSVGHCSRCRTVVEPRLSLQWFVQVAPLAKAAGDAVRDGRTRIVPAELSKRYFDWVDNMHDWCISRQLWWGHRIPVWYCPDGHITVPDTDPSECATCGSSELHQDEDVLDTWFSSGLWPFSTLGWPDETPDLAKFYPTDVLLTGYDIIFFWVARMMMFGLYAMPDVPFKTVALTGLVRDARGKKMSKSSGTAIDPLDWMDRYGTDAVRFALARGSNPGSDLPMAEEWVEGARNFTNKLWNATRFAVMSGATVVGDLPAPDEQSTADRWILSRLAQVVAQVDVAYDGDASIDGAEGFEFGDIARTLQGFAWNEVCDWYIELAKLPINRGGREAEVTRRVLGEVFDVLLRLLHPLMPFVTEELWTTVTGNESVVIAPWPTPVYAADADAERAVAALQDLVTEVRKFRSEQQIKPGVKLPAVIVAEPDVALLLAAHTAEIGALARLSDVAISTGIPDGWSEVHVPGARVGLDLSGTIDVVAERARLVKAIAAAQAERDQVSAKLANPSFADKAPPPVVEKTRARLAEAEAEMRRLTALLSALPGQ